MLVLRGDEDRRCPLIELVIAALAVHILRHCDHDWLSLKPCELSRPGRRGLLEIPFLKDACLFRFQSQNTLEDQMQIDVGTPNLCRGLDVWDL